MQTKEGQRGKRRSIRGVVFDMDGTLTVDGLIDFPALKRAAGCPPGVDVLAHLASLAGAERKKAEQAVEELEEQSREKATLNEGCVQLLKELRHRGLNIGMLTRNTDTGVEWFLDKFDVRDHFDVCISRSWTGGKPKPHPCALLHISKEWKLHVDQILMVGDAMDDIAAGNSAGTHTALLHYEKNAHIDAATYRINSLPEILTVIDKHTLDGEDT